MAERKQVNRYYPPDFDPAKHKSINKYRNSHPLRERAKKLSQGILVIRFEMPYNIWCGGCGNHVGMGVRYNAEKKKVGKYYTTPIYQFKMKCHLCDNYIVMETDPKNFDYTIVSGAQRKNQKWDMAENEQVLTEDREAVKKLSRDAMYKLEHGVDDTKKLKKAAPSLSKIAEIQSAKKDDYAQNQALRKKFRMEKKELLASEASDNALLSKSSLEIELVPETDEDKKLASLLKYTVPESYEEKREQKRELIQNRNIFAPSTVSSPNIIEISPRSSSSSSSSSSSKSSSSSRTSGAQQTLINKVMKKASIFGLSSSKGSSSSFVKASPKDWSGRATKPLIGGTTGIILKRKRKRVEDGASPASSEAPRKSNLSDQSASADNGSGPLGLGEKLERNMELDREISVQGVENDELGRNNGIGMLGVESIMSDMTKAASTVLENKSSRTRQIMDEAGKEDVADVEILPHSSHITSESPLRDVSSKKTKEELISCDDEHPFSNANTVSQSHMPKSLSLGDVSPCSVDEQNNLERSDRERACSHNQTRTTDTEQSNAIAEDGLCEHTLPTSSSVIEEGAVGTDSLRKSSLSLVSCYSSSSGSEEEQ